MTRGRTKVPAPLAGLLRSEWDTVIYQSGLSHDDQIILIRCVCEQIPQIDVAIELDLCRNTVATRLRSALAKAEQTAKKLNIQ